VSAAVFLVASTVLAGDPVLLDGDEGHHAARVLRVRVGETVAVTDGHGGRVEGRVLRVDGGRVEVSVDRREQEAAPQPRVVVAQALPKGERAEIAVQLMTEVGVDAVVPWQARRCEVRWEGERGARSRDRWQRTADAATKQARRAWALQVEPTVGTGQLLGRVRDSACAVVLDAAAPLPLQDVALPAQGEVLLVVGPEGGITDDELAELEAAGARCARLGPSVMRTSTAGAVAAALVLAATARWAVTP
jgi:16S rRNA (uracil1498-N3)-methyltransferase